MASPKTLQEVAALAVRMRELLSYDPYTGVFTWMVKRSHINAGDIAGSVHPRGYRLIAIDDRDYRAHKLAWLWMTGEWPVAEVDHRDLSKDNNAWKNLRPATRSQNCANKTVPASNLLGVKGVSFQRGRYRARIYVNRKCLSLGSFEDLQSAQAAVVNAGMKHHGEFYHVG